MEQLTRDRIIDVLRQLPPEATLDDAIERILFFTKIEGGLSGLDEDGGVSHDEVKWRLAP